MGTWICLLSWPERWTTMGDWGGEDEAKTADEVRAIAVRSISVIEARIRVMVKRDSGRSLKMTYHLPWRRSSCSWGPPASLGQWKPQAASEAKQLQKMNALAERETTKEPHYLHLVELLLSMGETGAAARSVCPSSRLSSIAVSI